MEERVEGVSRDDSGPLLRAVDWDADQLHLDLRTGGVAVRTHVLIADDLGSGRKRVRTSMGEARGARKRVTVTE